MGLLDYYRQFEDADEGELNKLRRERRARERRLAVQQIPELDLASTEWPEFPINDAVNAEIYTARGRVNGYPDRHAETVRRTLAERHGVSSSCPLSRSVKAAACSSSAAPLPITMRSGSTSSRSPRTPRIFEA